MAGGRRFELPVGPRFAAIFFRFLHPEPGLSQQIDRGNTLSSWTTTPLLAPGEKPVSD